MKRLSTATVLALACLFSPLAGLGCRAHPAANSVPPHASATPAAFASPAASAAPTARASQVTVTEDETSYTISNGIMTARISKRTGGIESLKYHDIDTFQQGNREAGKWSHSAASANTTSKITIDPTKNGGKRAEVAVKGKSGGRAVGAGPGGSAVADIEIRYTLEAGQSGMYTYCIWDHPASYPATSVGEARFYVKLNDDIYDWMTVDKNRNMKLLSTHDWNYGTPMNMKEARMLNSGVYKGTVEHKYDYTMNQFDTLAWGWSSTTKNTGFWFINPTDEYLSGGPTKLELAAHRDATFTPDNKEAPAPPCLLNYWRGSHYGGSECSMAAGEHWNKVIGPFLIYCNSGDSPDAMWKDALARSAVETKAWPYDWVQGVDFPHKEERATVKGRLVLNDQGSKWTKLMVGVTAPPWSSGGRGGKVDWQNDAKNYQFWVKGNLDGTFEIPNVRPGKYVLHAIADGVLGEYVKAEVNVEPGKALDLGTLEWKPERFGKQLWDIGIPDRSAAEYLHGDNYWHWGLYLQYPKDFPNDVNYTIGTSDFHKDWNYVQVPRAVDEFGKAPGKPTTWTVRFNLLEAVKGEAVLRLALTGTGGTPVYVKVNEQDAGTTGRLQYNATINRDSVYGFWKEVDVRFNASMLKAGENVMQLSIDGGSVMNGVEYDYLRLELVEPK